MRTTIVAGSALAALALAAPLYGQVSADVIVRTGPVRGHVAINEGYSTYRHAEPRPVVVYERPVRVIVVKRFHSKKYYRNWKRYGYRPVTLYYDDGRYYDRRDDRHPGLREVVVYEHDGHYYRDYDDRDHRRHDHDGDRDDYRDRHHDRD